MFANTYQCVLPLLMLIFVEISQTFFIVTQDYNTSPQINKCIVKIIDDLPGIARKISFLTSDNNTDFTAGILRDIRVPVLVDTTEDPHEKGPLLRIYNTLVIIRMENLNVTWVLNNVLWNGDTKFVVVADIEKIDFREFWKESVVNAFVLSEDAKGISLYSFVPYNAEACDDVRPTLLDNWRGDNFVSNGLSELYDNQRIKDMHKCPINIGVVNLLPAIFFTNGCTTNCNTTSALDGTEARYMKVVAEVFNFIGLFYTPHDGQSFGGINPPKGVVGDVYLGVSHFGFGLIAPIVERYESLDLSNHYREFNCLTFSVPVGSGRDPLAWFNNIKSALKPLEWILILISLICVTTILWIASNFNISRSFLYTFGVLMGHAVNLPDKKALRLLIAFWILFSCMMIDIYNALLGSEITVPLKPPEIKTFLELVDSDLLIMGHPNMFYIIKDMDPSPVLKEIKERFIKSNIGVDDAIKRMSEQKDIAFGGHMSTFLYAILKNPPVRGIIRPIKQCIYEYFSTIVLRKHSPFTRRTNKVIWSIFESGIDFYWKSFFMHDLPTKSSEFVPMRLKRSYGMVSLLLAGLFISFLVFLGEVIIRPGKRKPVVRKVKVVKRKLTKWPLYPLHFRY